MTDRRLLAAALVFTFAGWLVLTLLVRALILL